MNLRCYSKSHECHKASPNFVASTLHMPPPSHTPCRMAGGVLYPCWLVFRSFNLAGSSRNSLDEVPRSGSKLIIKSVSK